MDKKESLNHPKWDCKCHVVFIPKKRRKVLYAELRKCLGEVSWIGIQQHNRLSITTLTDKSIGD